MKAKIENLRNAILTLSDHCSCSVGKELNTIDELERLAETLERAKRNIKSAIREEVEHDQRGEEFINGLKVALYELELNGGKEVGNE